MLIRTDGTSRVGTSQAGPVGRPVQQVGHPVQWVELRQVEQGCQAAKLGFLSTGYTQDPLRKFHIGRYGDDRTRDLRRNDGLAYSVIESSRQSPSKQTRSRSPSPSVVTAEPSTNVQPPPPGHE